MAGVRFTSKLAAEYETLFTNATIRKDKWAEVDWAAKKAVAMRPSYEAISAAVNDVPWYVIAAIHMLECSFRKAHLHNGDPLSARTVNVPAGYPKTAPPPYTFEYSAIDALRLEKLDTWKDWSIGGIGYKLEGYNGFGYRGRDVNSPYLWSYTQHYTRGKYIRDGVYSATAVSKQVGMMTLLRRLAEMGEIPSILLVPVANPFAPVPYAPRTFSQDALRLQNALNTLPNIMLRADGHAGPLTSAAYYATFGAYLSGDLRSVR